MTPLQHLARTIYTDALRHVDVRASVRRHLHAESTTLTVRSVVVSPQITTEPTPTTPHLQLLPGAHPTPNS